MPGDDTRGTSGLSSEMRVGEVAMVADQAHYAGLSMFAPGAPVRLGIDPTQVRFLDR